MPSVSLAVSVDAAGRSTSAPAWSLQVIVAVLLPRCVLGPVPDKCRQEITFINPIAGCMVNYQAGGVVPLTFIPGTCRNPRKKGY